MKRRTNYTLLTLLLILLLSLSACGEPPSEVSVVTNPETTTYFDAATPHIIVNISSKTIHHSASCSFVLRAKEENLRTLEDSAENTQALYGMGYKDCKSCLNGE